jgi:hypothetical protein
MVIRAYIRGEPKCWPLHHDLQRSIVLYLVIHLHMHKGRTQTGIICHGCLFSAFRLRVRFMNILLFLFCRSPLITGSDVEKGTEVRTMLETYFNLCSLLLFCVIF